MLSVVSKKILVASENTYSYLGLGVFLLAGKGEQHGRKNGKAASRNAIIGGRH